jgi:phytoene synthase
MNTIALFDEVCLKASRTATRSYSTSFSLGIRSLEHDLRGPIHSIYGFVRFADEIVDTFHGFDKASLLARFRADTHTAIQEGISLNPILQSFQRVVNGYGIEPELYNTFLDSMAMDLQDRTYDQRSYETYILGSAEGGGPDVPARLLQERRCLVPAPEACGHALGLGLPEGEFPARPEG